MPGMAAGTPFFSTSMATMIAMMVAMMLPSALQQCKRRGVAFGAGYLFAWAAVGAVVAVVPLGAGLATLAGISLVSSRMGV
jgi:hypothetical protein